jgi:hypothetical protein
MTATSLAELRALQDPDGCFPSWIVSADGSRAPDRNGYVTAMVLRTLRHRPEVGDWKVIIDRAVGWIEACRAPQMPTAFAFWPEQTRPAWAAGIPPDVDDTAVMLTELLRHDRIGRMAALRSAWTVLERCRLPDTLAILPPWITAGSYLTWVVTERGPGTRTSPNPVDACVNANVVALLSSLDATHLPGYDAAIRTVVRGLDWAGEDPRRLSALTPFYPAPRSLADAVAHAVECGAEQLRDARERLAALPGAVLDAEGGSCRIAYGDAHWQAPAIDLARVLASEPWS